MDPETIQALLEAADLFSTGMRAFQSEYNTGYTPEEFEDYLLKCAGETADSNLQLACAEVVCLFSLPFSFANLTSS